MRRLWVYVVHALEDHQRKPVHYLILPAAAKTSRATPTHDVSSKFRRRADRLRLSGISARHGSGLGKPATQ
jgi:hypothetical protein